MILDEVLAAPTRFAEILSILAAFASTVGIFITHVLTRSTDRNKQHDDYVKQETRELLTALSVLHTEYEPYAISTSTFFSGKVDEGISARYNDATVAFTGC